MNVKYHSKGTMGNPNKLQIWFEMSSSDLLIFPFVKADLKWHTHNHFSVLHLSSLNQMLNNQRLLKIRMLSKDLTEAGHLA